MSRRSFLYGSALAAGSVVLAACSSSSSTKPTSGGGGANGLSSGGGSGAKVGSARQPLAAPASFHESPALKGKGLPAVKDRLPESPYVVPHAWVERGNYGGVINTTVFGTTGMQNASSIHNYYYGFSPTRWLNDGTDIGPGTAEKWTSNADATEWTVYFRKGLKWSDGHPFSVDDVLFWYYDMAVPGHDAQTVPPDCQSAKGTPCVMKKVDESTLKITYDAPQPLVPEYLAAWAKGNIGQNGPIWVMPSHYLKQFHPKYNKNVPKDWDSAGRLWEQKANWSSNPDCPTLTGYKCKSFNNNSGAVFERNPYYYVVTKDGDQLPYIDEWRINITQNAQAIKLQVQQGKLDYCDGTMTQIDLSDVSTLSQTQKRGNYKIVLWDSGDGTGSMFFLNYDYIAVNKKYGTLFRDKRFRQAISYAFDRPTAQKALYFETGEQTTGTSGVKITEFSDGPDGPKLFTQWRDSYKAHDVAKAKSLLAELGLKDTNGDGYVEFSDGSKLSIDIPYSADIADTEGAKDDQLVANAKTVGLRMVRRPIPPQSFADLWNGGTLMSHSNWSVGDGATVLVYPQWLVPLEPSRWAPLEGSFYTVVGTPKEHQETNVPPLKREPPRMPADKGGPVEQLTKLYNQTKSEPDHMKRNQLVWKMFKIHIDEGPFFMGTVANFPRVNIHSNDLRNVPDRNNLALHGLNGPWVFPTPAMYDPECWYWDNPSQHQT